MRVEQNPQPCGSFIPKASSISSGRASKSGAIQISPAIDPGVLGRLGPRKATSRATGLPALAMITSLPLCTASMSAESFPVLVPRVGRHYERWPRCSIDAKLLASRLSSILATGIRGLRRSGQDRSTNYWQSPNLKRLAVDITSSYSGDHVREGRGIPQLSCYRTCNSLVLSDLQQPSRYMSVYGSQDARMIRAAHLYVKKDHEANEAGKNGQVGRPNRPEREGPASSPHPHRSGGPRRAWSFEVSPVKPHAIAQTAESTPTSTALRGSRQESRRLKSLAKPGVQERAALLVARDDLSDAQIAQQCGIDRRTLTRWKKRAEFQAQIEQRRRVWRQEREAQNVAKRKACFASLDSHWKRLWEIVANRDTSSEMRNVPGGRSGFLYGRQKTFRSEGKVHVITDYYLDSKVPRQLRTLEVQAAKNLQQWGEPLENPDGSNVAASCNNGCPLSGKREHAAQLAGEDQLSDAEIADCCRISRRMLSRWRWEQVFQERSRSTVAGGTTHAHPMESATNGGA